MRTQPDVALITRVAFERGCPCGHAAKIGLLRACRSLSSRLGLNSYDERSVTGSLMKAGQPRGTLMRMRTLLPLIGLLALAACKDEKKAETTNPPPASTTAPANPAPAPGAPANPPPANKPTAQ